MKSFSEVIIFYSNNSIKYLSLFFMDKIYFNLKLINKIIKCFFFSLILYIIIISFKYDIINKDKLNYKNNESYNLKIKNKNYSYIKYIFIREFNTYINKCLKSSFKDMINYNKINSPKISVIMPLYNAEQYFKYSLCSIQNQKMKEIEIILIDDCSTDNTLIELEKYIEKDKRIKLIKNRKNRKILYSKSLAALNSNSKYIMELDQDDIFIRNDLFDFLYYEAKLNKLDLVQIRDLYIKKFKIERNTRINYRLGHFIFKEEDYNCSYQEIQPLLKNKMFLNGNVFLLWGLLIKTDIYKKAIYYIWPLIMNYQIIFYEDYIITSLIVIFSKKYKYLNNFGLIHLDHDNSAMKQYYDQLYIGVLFCENIIYNYYIKNNPRDIIILINFIKRYKYIHKVSYKQYPKLFSNNIINIINNEYVSTKDKEFILKELNISYTEFMKWNSYKYFMNDYEYNNIYKFQLLYFNYSLKTNNNYLNPKISIILYCLTFKYLIKTINSIQNQKNIDIEIILIYDNDNKNEFYLINNILGKYQNIKLFNNKNNKGFLFSYSSGVLKAKGEYILILKSGETLAKEDILQKLYYIAKNNIYDILEFNLLINNNNYIKQNSLKLYKCQHIKSEINISFFKYNKDYKELDQEDEILTNKIINSNLFKYIINKYNLIEYKNKVNMYFNEIIFFLLIKEKAKLKHFDIIGLIQYNNITNKLYLNNLINTNQKIKESLFYINFLFENTNNTYKDKKYVLNEFYNLLSIIFNKFNRISKESIKLFKKFLNCKFISKNEKQNLKFYYNSLIN